ncbi:MAG: porin family protein, partial [Bacteroidota bacterium]|nr:porin family protein [Bacteroidota bacterium]
MKKILLCLLVIAPACCFGQFKFAVKAGLNFANVTDKAGINANSRTGYMIGGYISSKPKFFGFRSEIMLSRQGYDYESNTNTGKVNLDYLLLPQLITLNFTKKVQLHAGLQAAFLLNANVDSSGSSSNGSLFDYFNRFDYGFVGGGEIFPIGGFFLGARINVSLNNANKEASGGGNWPNFLPKVDIKNNVVQLYAGWRF